MKEFFVEVRSFFTSVKRWWKDQDIGFRHWVIGLTVGLGVFMVGGLVLHAAMAGLMVNFFFWYGMYNPQMKAFMERHGRKIDVTITVGSIVAGLVVGPTMGLSMMFIAGFFSFIRRAVCPALNEQATVEGQIVSGPKED